MNNSRSIFQENIRQANDLGNLYDGLGQMVPMPGQFDDLLRSQIVHSVSAFDKLIHDLIRIGMVQIFLGQRAATPKYLNEQISIQNISELSIGASPPPSVKFEQIVRDKLGWRTFQEPDKIAEGLSFIWIEDDKWKKIGNYLDMASRDIKLKLKIISTRRNSIVHEADHDPISNQKQIISRADGNCSPHPHQSTLG